MLMAHVDTVPICVGTVPQVDGNTVRSGNPQTGLGADDRAGAAVVLQTALEILTGKHPHPPLTFLWTVQEEVGLYGARFAKLGALGKPKLAFNWDGGSPEKLTIGATGAYRIRIEIEGVASHAGVAPQEGVSAIAIAGLAIADLVQNGWHGKIEKGKHRGTSNIGVIRGGEATNVVTDRVELRVEARSHDGAFRKRIVKEVEQAFARAAAKLKNSLGARGKIRFDGQLDYESFRLAPGEPCVELATQAVQGLGFTPVHAIADGGLDANWLTERGIPTVTLGCGQMKVHTLQERLDLDAFQRACQIGLAIATRDFS